MGIRKAAILSAAMMLTACLPGWAAGAPDTRIEQALVNLPEIEAVVYAAGDGADDISAALDGRELEVVIAEPAKALPTDYYFMLDVSGSINKKTFDGIKAGLNEWREKLAAQDRLMLITFGSEVKTVLSGEESDKAAAEIIDGLRAADKKTRLFDGMSEAVRLAAANRGESRRLLVLITDGKDISEGGSTTRNEIDKLLGEAGIPLYAIGLGSSKASLDALGEMARGNGGSYYKASDTAAAMNTAFSDIASARVIRMSTGSNIADGAEKRLRISCGGSADEITVRADRWIKDTQAPTVESAEFTDDKSVTILFSEPVSGAEAAESFALFGKNGRQVEITGAYYDAAANTAVLRLAKAAPNGEYTLNIAGIRDVSMEENSIEQTECTLKMTEGKTRIFGLPIAWAVVMAIAAAALTAAAIVVSSKRRKRNGRKPKIEPPQGLVRAGLRIIAQDGSQRDVTAYIGANGYTIGRSSAQSPGIDLNIENDMYISRRQCRLVYENGTAFVLNLSDTNATKLNGRPISAGEYRLTEGDDIEIGQTRIIVKSIGRGYDEPTMSR